VGHCPSIDCCSGQIMFLSLCGLLSLSLLVLGVVVGHCPSCHVFSLWAVVLLLWAVVPLIAHAWCCCGLSFFPSCHLPFFFRRCCGMLFFPSRHLSLALLWAVVLPLLPPTFFLDVVVGCCSSPLVTCHLCMMLLWAVVCPLSSLSILLLFTASFFFL
jgi:hypothetical protein